MLANVQDTGGKPSPVDANVGDVSPYGVLHLAGNVYEWIRKQMDGNFFATRGCSWFLCTSAQVPSVLAINNTRAAGFTSFELGFRCVVD